MRTLCRITMIAALALFVGGCATLASNVTASFADSLSQAILGHSDPETVRDGAPAYLLLMDSLVTRSPTDPATLEAAATLYAAYGALFVTEPSRAQRVTQRARDYADQALCQRNASACLQDVVAFEEFAARLAKVRSKDLPALYVAAVSRLAWIRAHSADWVALAQLPHAEAALLRVQELDPHYEEATVQAYLGILNTLRPPALGGEPEVGREHFERAIAASQGQDLGVKVEFARNYARLLYDRELHDRLLTEVVDANPQAPGLTLLNVLAQRQAQQLLDSADTHF